MKCFDKALEIDSLDSHSWKNRGHVLYKANKFEEAIYCYEKAIEIKYADKEAWNSRGNAYSQMLKYDTNTEGQNYKLAKKSYEKAIEIDKTYTTAYNNFALLDVIESHQFGNKGKLQDAKEHIEKSYKYKSDDPQTLDNFGVVYYHLEDYDKAAVFQYD